MSEQRDITTVDARADPRAAKHPEPMECPQAVRARSTGATYAHTRPQSLRLLRGAPAARREREPGDAAWGRDARCPLFRAGSRWA